MFHRKKRRAPYTTLLDHYATHSEKVVFKDEDEKERIKELIWNRIEARINPGVVKALPVFYWRAAIAVALVIAACLFLLKPSESQNIPWTQYENFSDTMQRVWLPDSSSVLLQRHSVIAWPNDFNELERRVALHSGEGFFSVTKQHGRPFTVATDNVQIRVLGTSFLIKNDTAVQQTNVAVMTGKVQVSANDKQIRLLLPHDQLTISQRSGQSIYRPIPESDLVMWQQGTIVLREETLATIAAYLSGYYQVSIRLSPVLSESREQFTFMLPAKASLNEAMTMLKYLTPRLKYKKIDGNNWEWISNV